MITASNALNGQVSQKGAGGRWARLVVGIIMMLLLGLIYAWSIFVAPLEAEFGWTRADTSLTFTICMAFFVIGLLTNGVLAKRLPARLLLWGVAVVLLAGFGLCSRINTVAGLYLSYGVLVGFAVGVGNSSLISTMLKWFPDRVGTASGILMMGFGLGGMVLGSIAARLMDTIGWRQTFLLFGIGFAVVIALGAIVIKVPPEGYAVPGAAKVKSKAQKGPANPDRSPGEMLRRPAFWLYIGWFTLLSAGGLIVIGHASPFAVTLGASATTAAAFAGLLSLCNGLGRVLTGMTYDRLGLRVSMLLSTVYLLIAGVLLLLAIATGMFPLLMLGFVFTGLSYGGMPTTSSTFSNEFYGRRHFAMNYGIVSAGLIPAALLGPYLAGVLYTSSGAYLTSFITILAFGVVAFVCSRLIRRP